MGQSGQGNQGLAVSPQVLGGQTQTFPVSGGATLVSLSGVTTGTGTTFFTFQQANGPGASGPSVPFAFFSMVVVASAGTSAGAVAIQVSLDGTNWFQPATSQTVGGATNPVATAAPGVFGIALNFPAIAVRAVVTTTIVGGTITATVGYAL